MRDDSGYRSSDGFARSLRHVAGLVQVVPLVDRADTPGRHCRFRTCTSMTCSEPTQGAPEERRPLFPSLSVTGFRGHVAHRPGTG